MNNYEKESIFWYGLYLVEKDNAQLKYYITTEKELISCLYPITYFGVIQYCLYKGISINEIPTEEMNLYTEYIIQNYDLIYKIKYRFVKDKPKKINIENEETKDLAVSIISNLLLPYINKFCFKTYDKWKNLSPSFIRENTINYEYDINHESEDGKIKTSVLYPFIFTLNLIQVYETKGLYHRVQKSYDKTVLLRKYNSGRDWKEKEIDYLKESIELLNNDEEWSLFLANFSFEKWNTFDLKERFKALFELSKLTTILMKGEITAVTMMADGEEIFEMLEHYLPLFIYSDKILNSKNELIKDYKNSSIKVLSPFNHQYINNEILIEYINSKEERIVEINKESLEWCSNITFYVFAKLRVLLLTHEYLPNLIDTRIYIKKKLLVDVLQLFEEIKEFKYKRKLDVENLLERDFYITEEEILEVVNNINSINNLKILNNYSCLVKLGKIMSYLLGVESSTASKVDYSLFELVKNILLIFGPHPLDHTVQTKNNIDLIYKEFEKLLIMYEFKRGDKKIFNTYCIALELPLKLYRWKRG